MGFFAKLGFGAAKVDAVLPKSQYVLGEAVQAQINITGGSSTQKVDGIYLELRTKYKVETDNGVVYTDSVIEKFKLNESFEINKGEQKSFPYAFHIPYHTPLTLKSTPVWLQTALDIDWSADPTDKDTLQIMPDARLNAFFEGLGALGFQLAGAECEKGGWGKPLLQELSFKAHGGPFQGRVNELELICAPSPQQIDLLVEIDHKAKGLAGFFGGEKETKARITIAEMDPNAVAQQLHSLIESKLA